MVGIHLVENMSSDCRGSPSSKPEQHLSSFCQVCTICIVLAQGAWLCLAVLYIALILSHSLLSLRAGWRQSLSSLFWLPGAYSSNPTSHCSLSGSLSYGLKTTVWQWTAMSLVYAVGEQMSCDTVIGGVSMSPVCV
jgi:hypothetical protein